MKIRIVNKQKFIRSFIIMIGITFMVFMLINQSYSKTEINYREDYIVKGDTVWSIAKKIKEENEAYQNKDIRDIMYEIKQVNHIQNETLKVGQKIVIPD